MLPEQGLRLVLDTNAALDWLLFADRHAQPIAQAVRTGQLHWVASPSMREELRHVLERGLARQRAIAPDAVLQGWDRHAKVVPEPPPQALRCSDPDDQRFIDLAFAAGAHWLVTRDKALLRLARPAAAHGISIVTPATWAADPRTVA